MLATLEEEFAELPLLPSIPLSVKSAESAAERTSVLAYMPRSSVAAAYRDVGAWLEANDGRQFPPPRITTTEAAAHV
jgi:chromosome partitioning protein